MRLQLLKTVRGATGLALLAAGMGAVGGLGLGLATGGAASATGTPVTGIYKCTVGLPAKITLHGSVVTTGTAPSTLHIGTTYTVQPRVTFSVTSDLLALAAQNTLFTIKVGGSKVAMVYSGFTGAATVTQTGTYTLHLPAPYNKQTYWRNTKTTTPTPTHPTKGTLKTKTTLPTGLPPAQTAHALFKKTPVTMTAATGVTATVETLDLTTSILVTVKCHPTNYATPVSFGAITKIKSSGSGVPPLAITTASPLPEGAVLASYSATLTATGGTGTYTWSETGLPTGLTLTPGNGKIGGTTTLTGTFTVKATVKDKAGTSVSKTLALKINGPLSVTSAALPSATVGTSYSTTLHASGGLTPYTWSTTAGSALPTGLSLASTGKLSGIPTNAKTFAFTVLLKGGTGRTITGKLTLKVTPKPLTITTTSLPGGVVGVHYTTTLKASGGTGTFTWSATTLPTGLTLATTGKLSGTPTKAGPFPTKVTVKDKAAQTTKKTLPITIAPALKITTTTLPPGTVGTAYSSTLKASGGETPYTWSATGLPGGLTIGASTGTISGAPTGAGTFSVGVSVKGTTGTTVTSTLKLKVTLAPLAIVTKSLPAGVVTKPYSATLTASGGTGTYTWTATTLPPGLTLTTLSGMISGTPTKAGTYDVKVTVRDFTGTTATATLVLTVNPKLALTTTSLPGATEGKAYAATLKASGGLTPYTWSAKTLPPGLNVTSGSGTISGTPTAGGKYTVKVTVTGATGTKKTATLAITVTKAAVGYWEVASDGGIFSFGTATFLGSMGGKSLNAPIVGMAATPTGGGYWEVASDGGIFSFGNAHFYGSMGGKPLNAPIVGMAATPTGGGYWEVASDGGIFSFGNAHFYGSMGGKPLNKPIVGIAVSTSMGYWEVASDGGIFSFGNAHFYGSMGGKPLNMPIVGIAVSTSMGYWEVASDGGIFSFGYAHFYGSMGGKPLNKPIVGIAATATGGGYWEVASDGGIFSFGSATFQGSMGGKPLNKPIVGMAAT